MKDLNARISEIIEYSGYSSSEFADEIDVQRSSISHITSGRNKPSLDFLMKVKQRFHELEWEWLITGEGEMLKSTDKPEERPVETPVQKPTALPDLFSLIGDEELGFTESEDRTQRKDTDLNFKNAPESEISVRNSKPTENPDSQRLDKQNDLVLIQQPENQKDKVKRIVLFFESGKFESFEP